MRAQRRRLLAAYGQQNALSAAFSDVRTRLSAPYRLTESDQHCETNLATPSPAATCRWRCRLLFVSEGAPDSAAQGGLPLHVRQLLGIAHGVEPGDKAVVDAHRHD